MNSTEEPMIQQLDFFKAPAPMIEQPSFIGTAPAPSPAERGETFSVPTYGIANADPLNMTKRNFEAWMAVQSEGPTKDAIRAARDKKEAWARRELEKLAQPVRRDYFGANGPTGHGEECHSDADPGL